MRCSQEQQLHATLLQRRPRKRLDRRIAVGIVSAIPRNVLRSSGGPVGVTGLGFCIAPKKQGRVGPRMAAEKASKFEAGIAGRAEHRGINFGRHQIFFKFPIPGLPILIRAVEAYLSIMMHKYSYILNGLAELSS